MGIVDTSKTVYELAKAGATIELQERLMQLRQEALEAQEEILALRGRVKELEAAAAVSQQMEFDGRVYWRVGEDGQRDAAFCPQCLDNEKKMIRVQRNGGSDWGGYWWDCPTCKNRYYE